MSKKLTTQEFIERAIAVHGNKYDYSKVVYVDNKTKVCIVCPVHGDFWQTPSSHLTGKGCKMCGYDIAVKKNTLTKEMFIERSIETHGNKYDYSKVIYTNILTKVCIICPEHGDFFQRPNDHINGKGCPICGNERKRIARTNTTKDFVQRASEIHDNKYNYSKSVYVNNRTPLCIICPNHGEFWQSPSSHLMGRGCPICSDTRLNTGIFIERAKKIHDDKYEYPRAIYIGSNEKVIVTCKEHGDFIIRASAHLEGEGCSQCAKKHLWDNRNEERFTKDTFLLRAYKKWGNLYDYSLVSDDINSHSNVDIICKTHGIFQKSVTNHLVLEQGCPCCALSKGEERTAKFLSNNHILFVRQYKISNNNLFCTNKDLFCDFFIPSLNAIIEYNGIQHYESVDYFGGQEAFERQQERDMALRQYCKEHKIKLIEIPYTEYDNIEALLKKELKIKVK